jgi:NAD(P)H-hydrate epimerase
MIYSQAIDVQLLDEATCKAQGITSFQLMQRAADVATRAIIRLYPNRATRMMILAGPGNNGGDALCIVRRLYEEGYPVTAFLYAPNDRLSDDCREAMNVVPAGVLNRVDGRTELPELTESDVIIDGLLGSGLNRPVEGGMAYLVQWINQSPAEVVAIDVPTGLRMGRYVAEETPAVVLATHTLTFEHVKLTFLLPECADFLGRWQILKIGLIPYQKVPTLTTPYRRLTREVVAGLYRPRKRFAHKGTFGHAVLVAGSRGMMGAAVLAARACLRSGVGLLTTYLPACGYNVLQTAVPEAKCATVGEDSLTRFALPDGYNALGIGPGLGTARDTATALQGLLENAKRPMVLDADALNLLATHPEWWKILPTDTILTPHPKEADRLLRSAYQAGLLRGTVSASPEALKLQSSYLRLERMRALAREARVIIVLKGAYTAVLLPTGEAWVNTEHGHAGMAVGGTGDTLTGVILAFLAAQYPPRDAALLGVYLHSAAADVALTRVGSMESWLPGDLIEALGEAFRELTPGTREIE